MRKYRERLALLIAPWLTKQVYVDLDLSNWADPTYTTTSIAKNVNVRMTGGKARY